MLVKKTNIFWGGKGQRHNKTKVFIIIILNDKACDESASTTFCRLWFHPFHSAFDAVGIA
jgi:hypothetical protein